MSSWLIMSFTWPAMRSCWQEQLSSDALFLLSANLSVLFSCSFQVSLQQDMEKQRKTHSDLNAQLRELTSEKETALKRIDELQKNVDHLSVQAEEVSLNNC